MTKTETRMTVTEKQQLQEGIWSLSLQYPEDTIREVVPGQFVGICPADP
jgi:ferredoxin-NADP reductase